MFVSYIIGVCDQTTNMARPHGDWIGGVHTPTGPLASRIIRGICAILIRTFGNPSSAAEASASIYQAVDDSCQNAPKSTD